MPLSATVTTTQRGSKLFLSFALNGVQRGKINGGHQEWTDRGMSLVWSFYLCIEGFSKAKNVDKFCPSEVLKYFYLILSHCAHVTLFLSLCCHHQLVYGASFAGCSQIQISWACVIFETLAWLRVKLYWHLNWHDCKRTEREGEVMLSLPPSHSPLSLCSLLNTLQWWCGCDGGGVEWSRGYPHLQLTIGPCVFDPLSSRVESMARAETGMEFHLCEI